MTDMLYKFKQWFFKPTQHCQIRYNTKNNGGPLKWRIIVDGEEMLASHIEIHGYTYGESSVVDEDQKMNMACDGRIYWHGTRASIQTGPGPEILS
jgi:hypothetical protein